MRVLICGSRDFDDMNVIFHLMRGLNPVPLNEEKFVLIHGAANGADKLSGECAALIGGWEVEEYPANWAENGKAAGPIRNQEMLDKGKPDVVYAFVNKPIEQSRGTADMVKRSRHAGLPVYVIEKMK